MALSVFMLVVFIAMLMVYDIGIRVFASIEPPRELRLKLTVTLLFGIVKINMRAEIVKIDGQYFILVKAFLLDILIAPEELIPEKKERGPRGDSTLVYNLKQGFEARRVLGELTIGTGDAFSCAMVCQNVIIALDTLKALLPFEIRYQINPNFTKKAFRMNLEGIASLSLAKVTNDMLRRFLLKRYYLSKGDKNVYTASN